ncbi:Protein NLP7 [Linum perenne]
MGEQEDTAEKSKHQNPSHGQSQQQQHTVFITSPVMLGRDRGESLMEMDLDLDTPWPLDQISFASSHPMSPLFLSSTDPQPGSPLWAFSDADEVKLPPSAAPLPSPAAVRDYPIFVTCNMSSTTNREIDDGKKIPPPPRWGFPPMESLDGCSVIKERMTRALRYLKESTEQHILAQVWAPVKNGARYVLTTSEQPFVLDSHCNGLNQYRMVSLLYTFSVDEEIDGELGLPGRVFKQKLPEWTPNVQYYSSKEYPRLGHALHYNVQGTLALPVFEASGKSCVAVVELVMTSQKVNYAPEVDKVCKALEAVNLKSSEILDHPNPQINILVVFFFHVFFPLCSHRFSTWHQICNEGRQNALAEILEILTVVCEAHKLPLAQTWVPCMHRSVLAHGGGLKKSCASFDGSCNGRVCMSVTDLASYVVDAQVWGFREACLQHHLQTGQGVAGRAFLSHNACFCRDITKFCKTQYPLVHYARMFGLHGCFSICLKSSHTGDDDYVLEFFLPPENAKEGFEQKKLLGSLLATMKEHFQSLKISSGMDLDDEEGFVEIIEASEDGKLDYSLECIRVPHSSAHASPDVDALRNEMEVGHLTSLKHQPTVDLDTIDNVENGSNVHVEGNSCPPPLENGAKNPPKKKRGKTEKSISLEVLQQHFAGSLKDAAKRLGVCPTTMKRICRQHGISRWPSRKINKVNRSLTKLKRVIESVQVADGSFDLTPLTTSPLPVAVSSISWPSDVNGSNQQNSPHSKSHKNSSGVPNCEIPGNWNEDQTQNGGSPVRPQGSNRSKSGSASREESACNSTSHGSCQGSPANESAPAKEPSDVSPICNQSPKPGHSLSFPFDDLKLSAAYSIPDALVATEAQEPFGEMLIEDAGSSKDLRNLCPSMADAIFEDRVPESSGTNPPLPVLTPAAAIRHYPVPDPASWQEEAKSLIIKAMYKEDIIRFRITLSCGIMELKEEVGKRLKLEVGVFDVKYLDDDNEWVLIVCDADLQECIDITRSSGSNIVRLSIHDVAGNLGSSCESTGGELR